MSNQIVITSGAKLRDLDDVIIGTDGILSSVAFNVANGVPRLDENGKILVSQLPNSVMEFKGVWNAATNTPTLVNGTGNAGDVWLCNVAGTVNFGAGPIAFAVGDYAVYTGTEWARSSGATGTVTSVGVSRDGNALAITGSPVTSSGTINLGFSGDNTQYINGAGNLTTFPTLITSIGLTMPAAFGVSNSPLTANGTIGVTALGYPSQYIRGDGTLADFPTSGGGGSSVSYYLNGGVSQGTIGGTTYYEMSKIANTGTGVDFSKTGDGFITAFLTDAGDPALLQIPAGNWNYEIYASMSSNGGTPEMYAELYVYDGTTFTLLSTSAHEILYDGINLNLYTFAMAVPETVLTVTDRLAIKLYATNSGGKTTTIHTQDSHLCQIITTFSTGLTALNGLTAQVQYFGTGTSGTDFNIVSSVDTHTFNIPSASATNRGLITTGTQTIAGSKTITGTTTFTGGPILSDTNLTYANSGYTLVLQSPTLSVNRTVTLPNGTGTLALTSDLSSYVPYTGATGDVNLGYNSLKGLDLFILKNAANGAGGLNFQLSTVGTSNYALNNQEYFSLYTLGTYYFGGTWNVGGITKTFLFYSNNIPNNSTRYIGFPSIDGTLAVTSQLTGGTVTSVGLSAPTGFSVTGSPVTTSGTLALSFASGYSLPTNVKQSNWDDAYTWVAAFPTQTGNSGKFLTTDGATLSWAANPLGTVTSVAMTVPTGLSIAGSPITSSGTLAVTFAAGYSIPTNASQTTWDTAYTNRITSLTVTGSSGASTLVSNVLNIPTYTLSGLGGQPLATNLTSLSGLTYASTSFVKMTAAGTFALDTNTYLTTASAASTYLPLTGGTLTGDLTITRAAITASSVNSTDTALYSYFSNQEAGVLKTYFLYLNSLFADVARRETLEIRNQVGKMTFYTAGILALTIDTTQNSTFAKNVSISNGVLNVYNGGSGESFIVNAGSTGNAIGVRTRTGNDYAFFNWRSIDGSELLAESYIQRTAANTATLRHTINNGTTPSIYQTVSSTGTITFNNLAGTGTRMVVADSNGLLSTQAIGGGSVTGSGTVNKVAKFTSTGSVIGDSIITATADAVTITSNLSGPIFVLDNSTASSYSQMQFLGDTKSAYIFKGNSTYTSYGGPNALNFYVDSTGSFAWHCTPTNNAMVLDASGNLGIGVGTTVSAKLDIAGGNAIIANNNNGGAYLNIRNNSAGTGAYSTLQLGNDTSNNRGGIAMLGSGWTTTGVYYANGLYLYTAGTGGVTISAEGATGSINFATNSTLKGIMNNSGYLGLNEPTPTNLLHLAGASATPSLRLASTSTGYYWDIGRENASTGDFIFNYKTPSTTSTEWIRITTLGKFGIGVTPTSPLHVSGSSGYIANFTNGTNFIKIYCGSTYSILEGNSGNQMGWLGSGFYIEAGTTPVNRFNISAAGLTTITGELTLTGTNTHMNIESTSGSYAYTRYTATASGSSNDMYLLQSAPGITSNGVSAGAAYFYMSGTQKFEFVWSAVSKVQITSTGQATFAGDVIAFSDISLKENIRPIENVLTRINNSRGVLYDRIDSKTKNNIGFIAQELEKEFPELVSINSDGTKGVKYQNAVAVLFEAIKEQQKQINELKNIN